MDTWSRAEKSVKPIDSARFLEDCLHACDRGLIKRLVQSDERSKIRILHEAAFRNASQAEESRSFLWVGALAELMDDYEKDRQRYPTLETFFPQIVAFFNTYASGVEQRIADKNERPCHS